MNTRITQDMMNKMDVKSLIDVLYMTVWSGSKRSNMPDYIQRGKRWRRVEGLTEMIRTQIRSKGKTEDWCRTEIEKVRSDIDGAPMTDWQVACILTIGFKKAQMDDMAYRYYSSI